MNLIIIFSAKYLLFISVAIALVSFVVARKDLTDKVKILWRGGISSLIALVIKEVSAKVFYDPRPFVVKNIEPLIPHAADNGFPSDHTLLAAVITLIVFTYNKTLGVILFIITLIIGSSRIVAEIHHPIDIIASIAIAFVAFYLSRFILMPKLFNHQVDLLLHRLKNEKLSS